MLSQRLLFSGLNLDAEPHLLQQGDYRYALNGRTYNAVRGALGEFQAILGHLPLPLPAGVTLPASPAAAAEVVGGCLDKPGNRVVYFLYHPTDPAQSGLYAYQYVTGVATALLTGPSLGLTRARIKACRVVGDTFYWTDFIHEPRQLNLADVLARPALYATLRAGEPAFLNLLRRGPQYPLELTPSLDPAQSRSLPRTALQFSYNYVYFGGSVSVIAPWSELLAAPDPSLPNPYNTLTLRIPAAELISGLVTRVELLVRAGQTALTQRVRSLPVGPLLAGRSLVYTGRLAGQGVDAAYVIKPFDYVPRRSRALEYVGNRLWLAGNVEGFARPTVSLSAQLLDQSADVTQVNQTLYHLLYDECHAQARTDGLDLPECTTGNNGGYYILVGGSALQPGSTYLPVVANAGTLTASYSAQAAGARYEDLVATYGDNATSYYYSAALSASPGWSIAVRQGTSAGTTALVRKFKGGATYRFGVALYDEQGRSAGVAQGAVPVDVPAGVLSSTAIPLSTQVQWTLDPAVAPPEWAASYQLVRTKNQAVASFLEFTSSDALYGYEVDPAAQRYFYSRFILPTSTHVFLDISNLSGARLGYNYTPGDRVRAYFPAPLPATGLVSIDVEVFGIVGNYLKVGLFNFGEQPGAPSVTHPVELFYEVYAPYAASDVNEPYYEVGPRYPVSAPHTAGRAWSQLTGRLDGDVYVLTRNYLKLSLNYNPTPAVPPAGYTPVAHEYTWGTAPVVVEAMSPYDALHDEWPQSIGRITAELREMKEEDKFAAVRFSNVFTQGSTLNGLTSFEPLNEELMPREDGAIVALQAVRGNLLLLQEYNVQSAYIGKTQLQDTQGKTLISLSDRVIGSHQPLVGGAGCQHPETVQEHDGYVYWWDCRQGQQVRYAGDGETAISKYGAAGYWLNRRRELLTDEPRPAGWYDATHAEYVCYPGAGAAGGPAMAFCEPMNRWVTFYSAAPEWALGIPGGVISAARGRLYRHDQDAGHPGRQHGIDYPVQLEVATALGNQKSEKVWQTLALEGSTGWHAPLVTTTTPDGVRQSSHLDVIDFETLDGQQYAAFLRDELTPDTDHPLEQGDELRSSLLTLRLEHHTPGTSVVPPARLLALTIGATTSSPY